ncbi:helix-turn-helix domain-containing protein [Mariniblastus sp.]|nr:helix-turn-helix domain-containing protein [Mariniblastus sp.]
MTRSIFTPDYRRFRRLLVQVRKESAITQVELANLLDRNQSYVSKFERGERRLDVVECLEVIRALDVDPIVFFKRLLADV